MAIFLPSAHALKRVVAGLGPELAPILRLEMAAWDVQATHGKHATRKPVTVGEETFLSKFSFCGVSVFKGGCRDWLGEDIDCEISCLLGH